MAHREGRPLIIYIHPREVDPEHPRLQLNPVRKIKCHIKLKKAQMSKLKWLWDNNRFMRMDE
ncbi:DUF3473 domain-containing protein [Candidatus Omnitrophota bacterium]